MKSLKRHHGQGKRIVLFIALIGTLVTLCAGFIGAYSWSTQQQIQADQQALAVLTKQVEQRIAEIEAKKVEPVYLTLPGADTIEVRREDYTNPDSLWVLVNKQNSVSLEYVPEKLVLPGVPVSASDRLVSEVIEKPLIDMFAAAEADGHGLMVGSAYRSSSYQASLFNGYVASAGLEQASRYSARPGHSEHQLGLAIDISSASQQCFLQACFTSTPDGQWLAGHAHTYGFTLRYPEGKEAITGYNFEPWHYRYVGPELATALYQSGLTLEEAWSSIEVARQTLIKNRAPELVLDATNRR